MTTDIETYNTHELREGGARASVRGGVVAWRRAREAVLSALGFGVCARGHGEIPRGAYASVCVWRLAQCIAW